MHSKSSFVVSRATSDESRSRTKEEFTSADQPVRAVDTAFTSAWRVIAQKPESSWPDKAGSWAFQNTGACWRR